MPRSYKRKTDHGLVSHEVMLAAVQLVMDGISVRKASAEKSVSKSALARYVKKYRNNPNALLSPNYSHSQVFSLEQEKTFEEYLETCSKMFHGLTPKHARKLAYEMGVINSINMPHVWKETKQAGADWLTGFLHRHPNLSIRTPEATSLARATSFNQHNINAYFDILEPLIAKLQAGGRAIFNLDETGCTTVQRVPKVLAKKGTKQVGQVTSRERGELVTLCGIVSATGVALPPVFVFPRKNYRQVLMNGAPEDALGLVHDSGWMTADNFVKVLEHVVKFTGSTPANQLILIMDNHDSHIALSSVLYAKENGINIVTLPPHTSNRTQPLDLAVYGPYKSFFNAGANAWMLAHPGQTVTIYQMAQLMGEPWLKAATPVNIMSGFKTAGVWPLDRNVFSSEQFLPATVTDRPLPNTSSVPVVVESPHSSVETVESTSIQSPATVKSPTTVQSSPFISPQQFRGYPKVYLSHYLELRISTFCILKLNKILA